MSKSVTRKIARRIDDVVDDLLLELKRAGESLGDEAEATLTRAAARLSAAAHEFEAEARTHGKAMAKGAVREVRAHPLPPPRSPPQPPPLSDWPSREARRPFEPAGRLAGPSKGSTDMIDMADTWIVVADGGGARIFEERRRLGPLTERHELTLEVARRSRTDAVPPPRGRRRSCRPGRAAVPQPGGRAPGRRRRFEVLPASGRCGAAPCARRAAVWPQPGDRRPHRALRPARRPRDGGRRHAGATSPPPRRGVIGRLVLHRGGAPHHG